MECTCPHIMIGLKRSESKNWNPDCDEHGLDSEWYNSEGQQQRLRKQRQRTIDMQDLARRRRRGEVSDSQAKEELKQLLEDT